MVEIGSFRTDQALILEPAQNGGWVVKQAGERPEMMAQVLGAYTNASDMLLALNCLAQQSSK